MKVAVSFRAAPIMIMLTCALAFAQTALSDEDPAHQIDWKTLGAYSPIPEQMPDDVQSDDPWEAGFAREWIEHVVAEHLGRPGSELALAISSQRRSPDDEWAAEMEEELREIVQDRIPRGRHIRVFCNSVGCLCYVEREEPGPIRLSALVMEGLVVEVVARKRLGLERSNIWSIVSLRPPQWELTIVPRPPRARVQGTQLIRDS